ncbi:MAG TPA: alkaline phosphatase family protein [Burkholderiales bacterium]
MLPDYADGSLVNLMASIAGARGAPARHAPLALLPTARLSDARNLVLLIIDGLGDNFLKAHGAGSALAKHRAGGITSVFPSTTASAITTSYTGATPAEHGLTGWFTWLGAAGCVAAPLPFRGRGEDRLLGARGLAPGEVFRGASLFDALDAPTTVVTERSIVDSQYNLHHCGRAKRVAYDGLEAFVAATVAAVRASQARKFIYAYWPHYDGISHRFGCTSPQALSQFAAIDAAFGELLQQLAGTDTTVIATADHGFMDSPPEQSIDLEDGPGLSALLRFPLSGERRIAWCQVQAGRAGEFRDRASDWLGDRAEVRASRELIDEGWFGPGTPHPELAQRIGDVALMMRDCYTIKDWVPGESRHLHIGNHGGASEDEMHIPLVVADA